MYYFATGGKSFKLFIVMQLNLGLLPASLNLRPVPYSTIKAVHRACRDETFDRFYACSPTTTESATESETQKSHLLKCGTA